MSAYLNNRVDMIAAPAEGNNSVHVGKSVELLDIDTGKLMLTLSGRNEITEGKTYRAVNVWSVTVGWIAVARYRDEPSANAAYNAALDAIRNGRPVEDLPTSGMYA